MIVVSLGAVLVGMLIVAFKKTGGSADRPVVDLGGVKIVDEGTAQALPSDSLIGALHEIGKSKDAGQEYIDSLTFLCDSTLIGLRDYGLLSGGTETKQVWGSAAGNIPVSELGTCTIVYPNDGSQISPANAAMITKPSILVISLGLDGLTDADEDIFINSYCGLIQQIQAASPNTKIICCSLTYVTDSYSGAAGLNSTVISEANRWLEEVCIRSGVYYCNIADAVCTGNILLNSYASSNGKALNSAGMEKVLEYLRTHSLK